MIREFINWLTEKQTITVYQNGNMPSDIVTLLNQPID